MTWLDRVHVGDCRELMARMPEASVDAIVTDPPYGIGFMGKAWDGKAIERTYTGSATPKTKPAGKYNLAPKAMRAFQDWSASWGAEALRVLKPGGHILCFASTRTYHRMVAGLEDAGFEIRDQLAWVFGSGFPKSRDISKDLDGRKDWSALRALHGKVRAAREALGISQSEAARRMGLIGEGEQLGGGGFMWFETGRRLPDAEQYRALKAALQLDDTCDAAFEAARREVIGTHATTAPGRNMNHGIGGGEAPPPPGEVTAPATDAAIAWRGWGTALKPAWEPIVLARKPMPYTVAENVLDHGTGALNIDGCRIGAESTRRNCSAEMGYHGGNQALEYRTGSDAGRWPANLMHDGSPEVLPHFPEDAGAAAPVFRRGGDKFRSTYGVFRGDIDEQGSTFQGDSGSAARFFYCPKASRADRDDGCEAFDKRPLNWSSGDANPGSFQSEGTDRSARNNHPTVKPTELMRWLCRLITPPGGAILDPFIGSGSTGRAALLEGFHFIGCEESPDYAAIAEARIAAARHLAAEEREERRLASLQGSLF